MSDEHGAQLAYGVQVQFRSVDALNEALENLRKKVRIPDVRCLLSGKRDSEDLFLVIKVFGTEVGKPKSVTIKDLVHAYYSDWDTQLETACKALGIKAQRESSWLLIPYIS